jgi:hypothetical protein
VFRTDFASANLDSRLLHWKFHAPRPDWAGSRSYVLERSGEFLSHGCVWPMPFVTEGGDIPACQIIDWAASSKIPGSGLLLRRRVEGVIPITIGIGGSPDTQRVMPASGYKTLAQFGKFVRVIRPFRQHFQRSGQTMFRRIARTGRAVIWSLGELPAAPAGWSVTAVGRFEPRHFEGAPAGFGFLATRRSAELLNYLLGCPGARMHGYLLHNDSGVSGHFLLSEVRGQTRLADLQLRSGSAIDWSAAVALATRAAAALPDTCEVVAGASLDLFSNALTEAGFRPRGAQPVFVYDRRDQLADQRLHITSADYDDFFSWYAASQFAA